MTRLKANLIGAGSAALVALTGAFAGVANAEPNLAATAKPAVVADASTADGAKQQANAAKGKATTSKPPVPASTAKKTTVATNKKPTSKLLARFQKKPETKQPVPASEVATTEPKAKPKRVNMKSVNGIIGTGMGYGCRYVRALCGSASAD